MSDWPSLLPYILCTLIILVVPGCLVLFALGARRAKVFLGSPLVTFAVIGLASLPSAWIPWSIWLILLVTAIAFVAAIGARSIFSKTNPATLMKTQGKLLQSNLSKIGTSRIAWLLAGVAVTAIASFSLIAVAVPDTDRFLQIYDAAFHMSVIRRIVETGIASPIGAGSVMGPANAVYPDAWHALVALVASLFNASLAQGIWIVVLTLLMFVIPCCTCLLVSSLFKLDRGFSFVFAALLPVVASTSAASYLTFGPLYANLCGLSVLPAAIAYAILAFDYEGSERRSRLILALLAGVLGLGFAHPNTVFTLTLFLLPLFISRCGRWWQRVGLVGLFSFCWAVCLNLGLFKRTLNCLDRVGEDVAKATSFTDRLGIPYDVLSALDWLPLLATVVIVAAATLYAVLLARRWKNSWYLVSLVFLVAMTICTFFPLNWFSVIATGFWYRDYYRFAIMLGMFSVILLSVVPKLALSYGHPKRRRIGVAPSAMRRICGTAGAVVCIVALCGLALLGTRSHIVDIRGATSPADDSDWPASLTTERARFCEQVASLVGDSVVLNNHNDASVWLYPIYGVNALAKGMPANQMGDMDESYRLLIEHVDQVGASDAQGEAVRRAADELGVEYLVQMGIVEDAVTVFDENKAIGYIGYDAENLVTDATPGFELVYEQDGMRLWKLAS